MYPSPHDRQRKNRLASALPFAASASRRSIKRWYPGAQAAASGGQEVLVELEPERRPEKEKIDA